MEGDNLVGENASQIQEENDLSDNNIQEEESGLKDSRSEDEILWSEVLSEVAKQKEENRKNVSMQNNIQNIQIEREGNIEEDNAFNAERGQAVNSMVDTMPGSEDRFIAEMLAMERAFLGQNSSDDSSNFYSYLQSEVVQWKAENMQNANIQNNIDRVLEMFPALKDRQKGEAGYLSGGEQQMLAIGRALMSEPEYLLLDEPSLGLAPKLVDQIAELIQEINNQGVTVLLVEQNANMALNISDHGYIMETGNIVMDNDSEKLLNDEDVREFYLGLNAEGTKRKSFKEVKHYKRKKRWLS